MFRRLAEIRSDVAGRIRGQRRGPSQSVARGDPGGHRIARRKHAVLAEVSGVVRALEAMLRSVGLENSDLGGLSKSLSIAERNELMRLRGRVEQRRRFKGRKGQPLRERRDRNWLHIDESGKSVQPRRAIADDVFALGAVALSDSAAADYAQRADELKKSLLGTKDVTFHEPDMRNREGPFFFGGNSEEQAAFERAVYRLIAGTEFTCFGVAIRKNAYRDEFVATGLDPYLPIDVYSMAIQLLLERYVDFLAFLPERPFGALSFESMGPLEDAIHQGVFTDLLLHGTQWIPDSAFRNHLQTGVRFEPKSGSAPSELADMWARDLFEWTRGGCSGEPGRWDLFESRIYCRGDQMMGKFGVKVFPDSDIRDLVEAHRKKVASAQEATKSASSQGEEAPIANPAIH